MFIFSNGNVYIIVDIFQRNCLLGYFNFWPASIKLKRILQMGRVNLAESLQTAFPLKMVNNHANISQGAYVIPWDFYGESKPPT